jgi:glycosyltransferase 2 family protein
MSESSKAADIENKKTTERKLLQLNKGTIVRLSLTILLLGILATQLDFVELFDVANNLDWAYFGLALIFAFLDRIIVTLRWWILLYVKKIEIGFLNLTSLHLSACFIGSFLPTSFSVDAVRIIMLTKKVGRGLECTAASVVDRLIMLVGMLILAGITFLLLSLKLPYAEAAWIFLAGVTCVLGILGIAFRSSWLRPFAGMFKKISGNRLADLASKFYWAMHAYHRSTGALLKATLLTMLALFVRIMVLYMLGLAVHAQADFWSYLLVMPMAWVIVMLPISIGGFGLQEGAYVALMTLIGITPAVAVAISLLDHLVSRAVALLGFFAWIAKPGLGRSVESFEGSPDLTIGKENAGY